MFYEMLTGAPPFTGENYFQLLWARERTDLAARAQRTSTSRPWIAWCSRRRDERARPWRGRDRARRGHAETRDDAAALLDASAERRRAGESARRSGVTRSTPAEAVATPVIAVAVVLAVLGVGGDLALGRRGSAAHDGRDASVKCSSRSRRRSSAGTAVNTPLEVDAGGVLSERRCQAISTSHAACAEVFLGRRAG